MKLLRSLFLLLVTPGLVWAQSSTQVADASQNNPDVAAELKALREALLQTQKQMASQQREIEALRDQVKTRQASQAGSEQAPRVIDAAMNTAIPSDAIPAGNVLGANTASSQCPSTKDKHKNRLRPSELVRRISGWVASWTLRIYSHHQHPEQYRHQLRGDPVSDTPQGHLTEYPSRPHSISRFDISVRDKFGANDVTGYCEADFSGNDAANAYQTVNGHTFRLRLCFMDFKRGKWEILGGQTWSWLTPNRNGLGPMPSDLALTYNEDVNIQVGLTFGRAAEIPRCLSPQRSLGVWGGH